MKKNILLAVAALLVLNVTVYGQFGGLSKLTQKKDNSAPSAAQAGSSPSNLLKFITLATDQGVQGMDIMATVFPPEKIAKYEETSKKYHEMQSHRQDGNIDADQYQAASDAAAEFAQMDVDWNSYNKDKSRVVPQADHRLSLMLLADGIAITQIPAAIQSLQSQVNSLASNPMQMKSNGTQIKNSIQLYTFIGKQMPKQVESYKTVRGIAKKIATAENLTLAPDPPAGSLKDTVTATNAIKELPPDSSDSGASSATVTTTSVTTSTTTTTTTTPALGSPVAPDSKK